MKLELRNHLLPLLIIFVLISIYWLIIKVPPINLLWIFSGFLIGAFLLDVDHLIYWFYLRPNTEESRLAQVAFKNHDYKSVVGLLESTHKNHHNLIFHHYFFQVVLALITLFVYTSSISIFTKAFLLALNFHLLIDEINDFYIDKKTLQKWLFARESKQLSVDYLHYYLIIFGIFVFIFFILLSRSFL